MYSQSKEEQFIIEYFSDFKGTVLDIGANDGKTFSNSLRLIELGWKSVLVEPSPNAFEKLIKLHKENNSDALCVNVAIGIENGKVNLHESGHHLKDKSDISLLSSVNPNETVKWKNAGVKFQEVEVEMVNFETLCKMTNNYVFDFITIDCEGLDFDILKQIDLNSTKLLCIEFNGDKSARIEIMNYCNKFGMDKVIYESGENLLICRQN
jgi:FkbM family methyltransferase